VLIAEQQFLENDLFYGHGTDNPLDEAVYLVFCTLDINFDCDDTVLDIPVPDEKQIEVLDLIDKRITTRKPAAYLVNRAWFNGYPFFVDERVLIPRSPIAELIQRQFSPWIAEADVFNVLDIGTGCGCIAIACAMAFPQAGIDAVDISVTALEVAAINIGNYKMSGRIRLLESDLFSKLDGRRYDIIVSNPPYVGEAEISQLPAEYNHEPAMALAAGPDGLDIIRSLLQHACDHLNGNGILVVEAGNGKQTVNDTFPNLPFTWIEFEHGGDGVFVLGADQLRQHKAAGI
jgi:ribosomal protein L3 glutamine methyltransferase